MSEPYYVPAGDEFGDSDGPDLSTSGIENLWIVEEAQEICRRPEHPFKSPAEKRKWKQIDKKYTKGIIKDPWLKHCFAWARGKNKQRLIIVMPALASYILNMAGMTDWNAEHVKEETTWDDLTD